MITSVLRLATCVGMVLTVATPTLTLAQPALQPDDRTGSPYLRVNSDKPDADRLPLKETRADVQIAGVIARVRVTQVYQNDGARPLEAVYVFPGSTRSAVFGMRMTVGDRVTVARIQEKDAARRIYETAKQQGKSASLLEQERPNVFTMNVANILPGDRIEVELDYVELLVPEDGVYELVYPTVVGPRYTGQPASSGQGDAWTANPYLGKGAPTPYTWGLSAKIEAGLGIASITSPSHRISPRFTGKSAAALEVDETTGGNKDFVLRYKLGGDKIETGVLLFPGATAQDESFFLMMMQPPVRLEPSIVPPREYIFVLDVSGSMHGYPLDTAKSVLRELIKGLKSYDRFNIMFFSGGNWVLGEESMPATADNVERALGAVGNQSGGGGTEILPALRRALAMKRSVGMSTSIVVVTDGYVSVEKETFDVIRQGLGTANLFSFGIGSSVNRFIIEGMARAGMGEPYVVLGPQQAEAAAARLKKQIESPVLTDVAVKFEGFDAYDVEPPTTPDLFAAKPIVVFGKYRGAPRGRITVTGRNGQGELFQSVDVSQDRTSNDNVALKYLWARHRIGRLSDFGQLSGDASVKPEVTQLGLKYNLLTQYTSFVAVDEVVRNTNGGSTKVVQPLPLPEGVEESALGDGAALRMQGAVGLGRSGVGPGGGGIGGGHGYGAGLGGLGTRGSGASPAMVSPAKKPAPAPRTEAERPSKDKAGDEDMGGELAEGKAGKKAEPMATGRVVVRADAAVRRAVMAHQSALRALWAAADPTLTPGTLRVELTVGPTGKVTAVKVLEKGALSAAVVQRLIERLQRVVFSSQAEVTRVTVELELTR